MNPNMVAQNRTARLVREANTPTYTSETPTPAPARAREHLMAVEWDSVYGRAWNVNIPEGDVNAHIRDYSNEVYALSDVDHWTGCWCFQ